MLDPDEIAIRVVDAFTGDEYWIDRSAAIESIADALQSYGDARAAAEREHARYTLALRSPAYGEWRTLDSIPSGALFETERGIRAVKSEYRYPNGHAQCVLLASGEYAHFHNNDDTIVRVIGLPVSPDIRAT